MANKFNKEFLKGLEQAVEGQPKSNDIIDRSNFKSTKEIFDKADAAIDTIPLSKLIPFKDHPFKIREGERLNELIESIKEQGILVPLIVRVHPEVKGSYEILAGHHRKIAAERADLYDAPCIIKNVDDNTAVLIVVESNKQRGFADMLPSEIAKALKLEYEALKSQGKRNDLFDELDGILQEISEIESEVSTCGTVCQKSTAGEKLSEKTNMSDRSIRYYIRLTNLIIPLLDLVDEGAIAISPAVDLSFLKEIEQQDVVNVLDTSDYKVDMKKAEKLKEYSRENKLNSDTARLILSGAVFEVKEKKVKDVKLKIKKIKEYMPTSLAVDKYEEYIVEALEFYKENGQGDK